MNRYPTHKLIVDWVKGLKSWTSTSSHYHYVPSDYASTVANLERLVRRDEISNISGVYTDMSDNRRYCRDHELRVYLVIAGWRGDDSYAHHYDYGTLSSGDIINTNSYYAAMRVKYKIMGDSTEYTAPMSDYQIGYGDNPDYWRSLLNWWGVDYGNGFYGIHENEPCPTYGGSSITQLKHTPSNIIVKNTFNYPACQICDNTYVTAVTSHYGATITKVFIYSQYNYNDGDTMAELYIGNLDSLYIGHWIEGGCSYTCHIGSDPTDVGKLSMLIIFSNGHYADIGINLHPNYILTWDDDSIRRRIALDFPIYGIYVIGTRWTGSYNNCGDNDIHVEAHAYDNDGNIDWRIWYNTEGDW